MAVGLGLGANATASVITRGLAETARLALEKVAMREVVKVRVHPSHAVALHQIADLQPELVEGDPTLQRGDLIVETTRGSLDASVERQLSEIERGFADRMRIGS